MLEMAIFLTLAVCYREERS
ncbi:hypothetical protein JTE90_002672, partial [Oedothorax gibbosus]